MSRRHPSTLQRRAAASRSVARAAALTVVGQAALALAAVVGVWHMLAPMLAHIQSALTFPFP